MQTPPKNAQYAIFGVPCNMDSTIACTSNILPIIKINAVINPTIIVIYKLLLCLLVYYLYMLSVKLFYLYRHL